MSCEESPKGSYEKIDYRLRPAKNIERKMLAEAFRRLSPFGKVSNYRYIGFGSTNFSDFVLFHRALGISAMISIERDAENHARFEFNRPFRCIEMRFETSNVALPSLNWDSRVIAWLDYDGCLDRDVLEDVKTVVGVAVPGSLLIVSVNAHPRPRPAEHVPPAALGPWRLKQLTKQVGDSNIPLNLDGDDLKQWGTARASRRIVASAIASTLTDRNASRPAGTKLCYQQLFNFHYSDGAKMLTVGGMLYDEGQQNLLDSCGFGDLNFLRNNETPYEIAVPKLTLREMRRLNSQLPKGGGSGLSLPAVPPEDIDAYAQVYRFFPTFAEADL